MIGIDGAATWLRSPIRPSAQKSSFPPASAVDVFQCHGGWNFTAVRFEGSQERSVEGGARDFFNIGVLQYLPPNRGLYEHTMLSEDIGKLRPPTLREHCNHRSVHA